MGVFSLIFGGLQETFSILIWALLVISCLVYLAGLLVSSFLPKLLTQAVFPTYRIVMFVALCVAVICTVIKVAAFIMYMLTAQQQIDKLEGQLEAKDGIITSLQQNAGRKEDQGNAVQTSDAKAETKWRTRYQQIETIRTVPDLSLANRLALDLTTNFYETEGANAQAPTN